MSEVNASTANQTPTFSAADLGTQLEAIMKSKKKETTQEIVKQIIKQQKSVPKIKLNEIGVPQPNLEEAAILTILKRNEASLKETGKQHKNYLRVLERMQHAFLGHELRRIWIVKKSKTAHQNNSYNCNPSAYTKTAKSLENLNKIYAA